MSKRSDYPNKYRPTKVSEVYGQTQAKKAVGKGLDDGSLPNSLFFHGPSGTGKTTLSRIIGMGLNCRKGRSSEPCGKCEICKRVFHSCHLAFVELNTANLTGVDSMRDIRQDFWGYPMDGSKYKIYIFDECHRLSKEAQALLLKDIEDGHHRNHFIFCSTDPGKVIKTLRNRCMDFEFKPLPPGEMRRLLQDVCQKERVKYIPEVLDEIVKEAEGMARNALYLLQKKVMLLT